VQLQDARALLQSADGAQLFRALFRSFSLSSAAAVSLAMLAQAHQLVCGMVAALAQPPLIGRMASTVVELSQVAALIEAPPFAALRLQLLAPTQHPALLKYVPALASLA
jgi:hypothetical protein